MKLDLDTIILYVQNVDELEFFNTDILKLEVLKEDKSVWVLLKAGNGNIGLHKRGDQYLDRSKPPFKFDNNAKIVFEISDDINQIRTQLLRQNVSMKEIKAIEGYAYWLCDGEDPEGNVFQLKKAKDLEDQI